MDSDRVKSEFERMTLTADLARSRELITKYEDGLAFYRLRVENARYRLGRLDERLGGVDADS